MVSERIKKDLEKEGKQIGKEIRLITFTILLLSFILFTGTLIISLFSIRATGTPTDLNFTYDNEALFDLTPPMENSSFNQEINTPYSYIEGLYNATYSFTGETGLSGTEPEYVDNVNLDASITLEVIASRHGHNEVLRLDDANSGGDGYVYHTIDDPMESGVIELWVNVDDIVATTLNIQLKDGGDSGTVAFGCRFQADTPNRLDSIDDGGNTFRRTPYVDEWYLISFEFDCATDKFNFSVNEQLWDDITYQNAVNDIDTITFYCGNAFEGEIYFDGIGLDNDPYYSMDDNMFPMEDSGTPLMELGKYEFNLDKQTLELYPPNSENVSGWYTIHEGAGSMCKIFIETELEEMDLDRTIRMFIAESSAYAQVWKNFSNPYGQFDITFNWSHMQLDTNGYFYFDIYSFDETLTMRLKMYLVSGTTQRLQYYDGSSFHTLYNFDYNYASEGNNYFGFNFHVYRSNYLFEHFYDGNLINSSLIPSISPSKDGLGKVSIYETLSSSGYQVIRLDSIGIYCNGTSLNDEEGQQINFLIKDEGDWIQWDTNTNNILLINITGTGKVDLNDFYAGTTDPIKLFDFGSYSGEYRIVINSSETFQQPYINCRFNSSSFEVFHLYTEKIIVKQGANTYYPTIQRTNVDLTTSYFYIESGKLKFYFKTDDSGLEQMRFFFDFPVVAGYNRSIQFWADKNSSMYAYLLVRYSDNTWDNTSIAGYNRYYNFLVDFEKYMNRIQFRITDNGTKGNYTTSGYLSSINLNFYPGYEYSISTLSLLNVVIPLIILLAPTIGVGKALGGKRTAYIMAFLFMSVITLIMGIIPVWLFFIIFLAGVIFILYEHQQGELF